MTDYIKRKDALRAFNGSFNAIDADDILRHLHKCMGVIRNISPADVVEVVRCKDCKYHAKFSSKCNKLHLTPMRPNYFCSFGERREA